MGLKAPTTSAYAPDFNGAYRTKKTKPAEFHQRREGNSRRNWTLWRQLNLNELWLERKKWERGLKKQKQIEAAARWKIPDYRQPKEVELFAYIWSGISINSNGIRNFLNGMRTRENGKKQNDLKLSFINKEVRLEGTQVYLKSDWKCGVHFKHELKVRTLKIF